MNDQKFSIRLRNSRKSHLSVYLEPWREVYALEPDKLLCVDSSGPVGIAPDNMLEIEWSEDSVTLWGWGDSNVTLNSL